MPCQGFTESQFRRFLVFTPSFWRSLNHPIKGREAMFLTNLTHYWTSKACKSKYNLPSILKKQGESMHARCFFVHFFNNRFLKQKRLRKFHLPAFLPFHLFPLKTQTNFFVQNSQKSPLIFYTPQKIIFFVFSFFVRHRLFFEPNIPFIGL